METNWNNSLEPTAADDVVLPVIVPASGSVITLTAGELANSLTINNDYTLTGGDLTLTAGGGGVVFGGDRLNGDHRVEAHGVGGADQGGAGHAVPQQLGE